MPETQAAYERLWEMVVEHAVQGRPVKLRLPDDRLEMRRLKMRIREQVVRCIMAARRPWSLHSQPAWDSRHWLLWLTEWAPE